jgi:hypothetical protein
MLRVMLIAALLAGCLGLPPAPASAQESDGEPQESIAPPANPEPEIRQATPLDSVSQGYYANYPARGYYAPYVACPNYPPKYPALLGYGLGMRGHMLYRPHYIFGHPWGYLRGHCPNDCKYGPVYYQSGTPVSGAHVEWLHTGAGIPIISTKQVDTVSVSPLQQNQASPER